VVGNDIVDLNFFETPAYHHIQFLSRACTPAEVRAVMHSPDPCRFLAMAWASKEATYKLVAREGNLRHFIPRQFSVEIAGAERKHSQYRFKVTHASMEVVVDVRATERWVHAIAAFPEGRVVHWRVQEIEQKFQDARQARVESEGARLLANELLTECAEGDVVLEFEGRMPAIRRKIAGRAGMGISLSHHGAFVAAAIALPLGDASFAGGLSGLFTKDSSRGQMCSTFTA
jgi:phosphopantetheine--protein transferase-like protein